MRFDLPARIALATLVLVVTPAPGRAQYLQVDSTADAPDANPGDGVCATAANECTLRAALEEANATPGLDFVNLQRATYTRTIAAELDVTDDVQINGPVDIANVDVAGLGRGLHIRPGVDVSISQVVVLHGDASSTEGGGILNEGTLRMRRAGVVESSSPVGAGIRNTGRLTVTDGVFFHNIGGPAISNTGDLTLERTDIGGNDDVGLDNRSRADLDFCEVDHNAGGGIVNFGHLEALRSTLWANDGYGALYTTSPTARAALKRCTVSGNRGEWASAVYAVDGVLTLEDVTIGANGHPTSPRAALDGSSVADIRVVNSIVAGNASSAGDPDCRVSVRSAGNNLMSCPLDAPDPTTFAGDPRLAPLKAFRPSWPSDAPIVMLHPLLPGSAAIDRGTCLTGFPDQRGTARPEGPRCDIGAFESIPLCRNGVGMTGTRLTIRTRPLPLGTTAVKVKARLSFTDPLTPPVDPSEDGLELRIEDLGSPGGALIERTDATRPLSGAWQSSGLRSRWRTSPDPLVVVLKDRRAQSGFVDFKATTKETLPPFVGPVRVTVVLGGDPLGANHAGDTGACAVHVFACTSNPEGTKIKCT